MPSRSIWTLCLLFGASWFGPILILRANVTMPPIFGDHMVLQREGTAPVWGTAAPGESVTVTAGTVKGTATAAADGKWMVRLAGLAASSVPIDLTVQGTNKIVFHDVLVGDVWICSGQSNMLFGIGFDASAKEEIAAANHPEIRLFMVPRNIQPAPVADFGAPQPGSTEAQWLVCTPETVARNGWNGFSAVGYFFGRDIAAYTHQPVGLIESAWGGTGAESWTSLEGLQSNPSLTRHAGPGGLVSRESGPETSGVSQRVGEVATPGGPMEGRA